MIRMILKQIWNRRRSNVWITVELMLVFCLVWFMVDYFFVLEYNYHIKSNRSTAHTWQIDISEYPSEHPEYRAEEAEIDARVDNYKRLMRQINDYKGVEAVAISFLGATPGSGSYNGRSYRNESDTINYIGGQIRWFDPEYDFFKVFSHTENNGAKVVSTSDYDMKQPDIVFISESLAKALYPDERSPVGRLIYERFIFRDNQDGAPHFTITGVLDDIKRFSYERRQNSYYFPQPLNEEYLKDAEISILSASSISDAAFEENFRRDMTDNLRAGNYYFNDMKTYDKLVADMEKEIGVGAGIKIRSYMMAFFLVNILLCVTGTFWYRVNIRREEIGLMKSFGASSKRIRNSFFIEGLLLLTIAAVPAIAVASQLVIADLIQTLGREKLLPGEYLPDRTLLRFIITNTITWVIMASVIIMAVFLPARKASRMLPADALHYE